MRLREARREVSPAGGPGNVAAIFKSCGSTSEEPPMPKPAEIVAALGDVSTIVSYATLRAEMVDLFTDLVDWMKNRNDERQAQIFRKMAATVDTIPYDMLAEFGHNYGADLICAVLIVHVLRPDGPTPMLMIWYSPCWMSCGASTSIILIRTWPSSCSKSSLNPRNDRTRTLRPISRTRAAAAAVHAEATARCAAMARPG